MDWLISLAVMAVLAIGGYAIVVGGRRKREAQREVFRSWARARGFVYLESDDGRASRFAADLDGIGQFTSPSLGTVTPRDVVVGRLNGRNMIAFRHSTRFTEGDAREWYVVGVSAAHSIAERASVQFLDASEDESTRYLRDGVVAEHTINGLRVVVRGPTPHAAHRLLDQAVFADLAELVADVWSRPEIQVRQERIAIYPKGRSVTIDRPDRLTELLEVAIAVSTQTT